MRPESLRRYLVGVAVGGIVLLAGFALYFLPRGSVSLDTQVSDTNHVSSVSTSTVSSSAASYVNSSTSTATSCNAEPYSNLGNISFVMTPSKSFLGPGQSENLSLVVLAPKGLGGVYSITGYSPNFLGPVDIRVNEAPTCASLATGRLQVNITVRAVPQPVFGTDYFDIIVSGVGGYRAQSYQVQLVPYLIQLLRGGFNPTVINVARGGQVIFFNMDTHDSSLQVSVCPQSCGTPVKSPDLASFETWNFTFDGTGIFMVTDSIAPGASCTVNVS